MVIDIKLYVIWEIYFVYVFSFKMMNAAKKYILRMGTLRGLNLACITSSDFVLVLTQIPPLEFDKQIDVDFFSITPGPSHYLQHPHVDWSYTFHVVWKM